MPASPTPIDSWLQALHIRHVAMYRPQEFTRALRALSARYVERRSTLAERSPLDSAGKRAAFAAFYAPLHLLTIREIIAALQADRLPITRIMDLGCGTGVAGAAWALSLPQPARILGSDMSNWALDEARWNWRQLGVRGRHERHDMVREAVMLASEPPAELAATGVVAGWSVNELAAGDQTRILKSLLTAHTAGASVLIVEPLARGVTPWWPDWTAAFAAAGGRADEWKFNVALPAMLAKLDDSAGFEREGLGARSLWLTAR